MAETRWTSVRSTSVKVMMPLSVRLPAGVTCSVTAPIRSCAVITGASLVPVMVTSICLVMTPPLLVVEGDGEALDLGLAGGQILDGGVGDRVGPGQLAAGAGAGGVAVLDRGERAQVGADRGAGGGNQMDVGEVDVGEGDDAAVGEIAGRA